MDTAGKIQGMLQGEQTDAQAVRAQTTSEQSAEILGRSSAVEGQSADGDIFQRVYERAEDLPLFNHPILSFSRDVQDRYLSLLYTAAAAEDAVNEEQLLFLQRIILPVPGENHLSAYLDLLQKMDAQDTLQVMGDVLRRELSDLLLLDMMIVVSLGGHASVRSFELVVDAAAVLGRGRVKLQEIAQIATSVLEKKWDGAGDSIPSLALIRACRSYMGQDRRAETTPAPAEGAARPVQPGGIRLWTPLSDPEGAASGAARDAGPGVPSAGISGITPAVHDAGNTGDAWNAAGAADATGAEYVVDTVWYTLFRQAGGAPFVQWRVGSGITSGSGSGSIGYGLRLIRTTQRLGSGVGSGAGGYGLQLIRSTQRLGSGVGSGAGGYGLQLIRSTQRPGSGAGSGAGGYGLQLIRSTQRPGSGSGIGSGAGGYGLRLITQSVPSSVADGQPGISGVQLRTPEPLPAPSVPVQPGAQALPPAVARTDRPDQNRADRYDIQAVKKSSLAGIPWLRLFFL